jgi:uncharacterized membrane protein (DUF4010 family)
VTDLDLLGRFAVALGVGLLIGLQRQSALGGARKELALGVRTFALCSVSGFASALLSDATGSYAAFAAVLGILGLMIAVGYFRETSSGRPGLTTRVAAVLTLVIGALAAHGSLILVSAMGVTITALLSFKGEMHRFARHLTREDLFAVLKFAVVSAVILPVLPDRDLGPFPLDAVNPYRVWLFVVLVSGIGFVGYGLAKWKGSDRGIGLTGLLGGIASSTAVTVGFSRRSREIPRLARLFAAAVMLAWTVMFVRVGAILAAVNTGVLSESWPFLAASTAAGLLAFALLWMRNRKDTAVHRVKLSNPFELGTSLKFGAIFTCVLVLTRVAQARFGNSGIYLSSTLSGLLDVDAVVFSTARMHHLSSGLDGHTASVSIALAAASNTLFKAGVCWFSGSPALRRAVVPGFLLVCAACLGAAFLF